MLRVRTEYKKGVLFVRLVGRIDNEGYLDKIKWLIEEFGIKITVLNISNLNDITTKNENHMKKYIKKIIKKKHLLFICDENRLRNTILEGNIPKITNEIEAFSLIRKDAYE